MEKVFHSEVLGDKDIKISKRFGGICIEDTFVRFYQLPDFIKMQIEFLTPEQKQQLINDLK